MNFTLLLLIVALCVIVALLWYAVRTHKTPAELEQKIQAAVDAKLEAFKAEIAEATEAAKAKAKL